MADLVLRDGVVWTGVAGAGRAEAVAVKDGEILAVGSNAAIDVFVSDETTVISLQGRTLTPGFIDAHTHFIAGGFQLASVDLRDASLSLPARSRLGRGSPAETGTMRCGVASCLGPTGSMP